MFDGKAFGEEMVAAVRDFVGRSLDPLIEANANLTARNAALEARLAAVEARDVAAAILPQVEAVVRAVEALPPPPDLSGFATKEDVAAVRAAIPEMPAPADLSGFASKAEVEAVRDAMPVLIEPKDFGPEIEAVRAAIPEAPDLSGFATKDDLAGLVSIDELRAALPDDPDLSAFATKDDVAEAVASIVIPEAIKGEDADPEAVAAIVLEQIKPAVDEELSEAVRRIDSRLARVRDGKDGKLPVAKAWEDRVHYEGEVATHRGALWQASADTGREPPHADWTCLAARGDDGLTPEFVGTYEEGAEHRRLDVVALNGGSFVALRNSPGPCPGDGWQLLASRGKTGPALKGEPGPPGDPGKDAAEVAGVYRSGDEIVVTFADGREMRA
jgi:hypothetical protein